MQPFPHPNDGSDKISLRLAHWLRRYSSLKMFTDTQTDRRDVPVGVPLDLSTPSGMSCIGTYGENCKSDNVSKYLVFAFFTIFCTALLHLRVK